MNNEFVQVQARAQQKIAERIEVRVLDPLGIIDGILEYPPMYEVRQRFAETSVSDISSAVKDALDQSRIWTRLKPGMTVAVTAGSRGIKNIDRILAAVVALLKQHGARPFLVASMGSHGGGTATGQIELLRSLGVNPETAGCAVKATDEVRCVGTTHTGHKVYCDKNALAADGILVLNRIKPHTSFRGPIESGLCKMLAVGLGKAPGATYVHLLGPKKMAEAIPSMASVFLNSVNVLAGLAVLENASDETAALVGIASEKIVEREPELLLKARAMMPSLPVDALDVLVVGEMGKNYSGTGMDTNVLGRYQIEGLDDPDTPRISRIVVLDLSPQSHGNATGLSLADVCTTRITRKYDRKSTYLNCLTSTFLHRAAIPPAMDNDWAAIGLAVRASGQRDLSRMKIAMIRDTLNLETLWVSETLIEEVEAKGHTVLSSEPVAVMFDAQHNLVGPRIRSI